MTTFDDREAAFENKFAHDEALRFRAIARRDRLVGLWAAQKLGKTDAEADAYARDVVSTDLKKPGDEDVFDKLRADLPAEMRLPFREIGLALGLQALEAAPGLGPRPGLADPGASAAELVTFWSEAARHETACWRAHRDINEVMLAAALVRAAP